MVVSELVISCLKESIGHDIVFWDCANNYRFSGKLLACDGIYFQYLDDRKNEKRLFKIADLKDVQIK